MVYSFIVLFFFLLIQFLSNNKFPWDNNLKFVITLSGIIILEAFRFYCQSIFGDIPNYKSIFEDIDSISFVIKNGYGFEYYFANVEIGFSLLISFFKLFSNNFDCFLFFVSVIELSVFYFFCRKFKIKIVNVLPIYIALIFITFEIGMLRQALGFSCFLLGLINIKSKTRYILFITLGCTFHLSTVFCFFLIWTNKFVNRKIYYFIFLLSLILYSFKIDFLTTLSKYIEIINFGNSGRFSYYLNEVDRANNYFGIGFWERVSFFTLMNFIYTKLLEQNKINRYNNLIFNLGISAILFQIMFFSSPTITSRLRYFVVIFPAIFISQYLYVEYKKKFKGFYQLIFSAYLVMYLFFLATYLE